MKFYHPLYSVLSFAYAHLPHHGKKSCTKEDEYALNI